MNNREKAAQEFYTALEKMRKEAVRRYLKLKKADVNDLMKAITLDMESFVMETLNFKGDIKKLMGAYLIELKGMTYFGNVTAITLEALRKIENQFWLTKSRIEISAIQKEIFSSIIRKKWDEKAIIERLRKGTNGALTKAQVKTEVTTALSRFNRQVSNTMMKSMPANQRYVYDGPLDEKTRDYGLEMMAAGELTLAEIESRYPDSLDDGCGFNCRGHEWSLITTVTKSMAKSANVEIQARAEDKAQKK